MKENLVIVGLSTNARHLYEFVKYHDLFNIIGFAVNKEYMDKDEFYGLPVYALEELGSALAGTPFKVFVAVMWNRLNSDRKKIFQFCKAMGYQMANIVSPLSSIRGTLNGENIWVHDYVVIQNDTIVGSDVLIMAQSLIGANCHIAPHCFFAAKSLLGGGSTVGDQSFIGLSSIIFDDTRIGKKCIVGACTAVKRNMPDYSKYVTSSDNIVIKQYTEDEIEDKLVFSKNKR